MPDPRACPRCNSSNRPEARFCDGCGTALALSCEAARLAGAVGS